MEIFGYLGALLIGVSLGLIGGGGSILTVPVLVYLFHIEPVLATAYSLFIVGTTSLIGAIPRFSQGLINVRTAIIFGIPSIIAVFITRKYIVPLIPETIFTWNDFHFTRGLMLMLLFALLMVAAAVSMIKSKTVHPHDESQQPQKFNYPLILVEGLLVGVLTGLVGAGGGFLIIPALVLLSKLPMKQAVGTSLLIIAAKSLIGFLGDITTYTMDWRFLAIVTALAIAGIFTGNRFSMKLPASKLKKGFGWFVLVMGVYIIIKEIFMTGA